MQAAKWAGERSANSIINHLLENKVENTGEAFSYLGLSSN